MEIFHEDMLIDPGLQAEIVSRCMGGDFGDDPVAAAHALGVVLLPDGSHRPAWLVHAADAVLLDDAGQTVLITRLYNPGRGRQALPGGLLDEIGGRTETTREAALREAMEETGISADVLEQAEITQIGHRCFSRPFDIRAAWKDFVGLPVKKTDLFTVSNLGLRIKIAGDLRGVALKAGDDATHVHVVKIAALTPEQFAVPDHLPMILAAAG